MNQRKTRNLITFLAAIVFAVLLMGTAGFAEEESFNSARSGNMIGWFAVGTSATQLDSSSRCVYSLTLSIEEGQSFYLGDYFFYMKDFADDSYGWDLGLSYSSSNPSAASVVWNTGKVTTHSPGTTEITTVYQGQTFTMNLNVLAKGALKSDSTYAALNKAAKKLSSYFGKKVTAKNASKVMKLLAAYEKAVRKNKKTLKAGSGIIFSSLSVPMAPNVRNLEYSASVYADKAVKKIWSKVSSIMAKSGKSAFTVNMTKALTNKQFELLSFANCYYDGQFKNYGKKTILVIVCEAGGMPNFVLKRSSGEKIEVYCDIYLKKGSKTLTIKNLRDPDDRKLTLQKGDTITTIKRFWKNKKSGKVK